MLKYLLVALLVSTPASAARPVTMLANPASAFCEKNGGKLSILRSANGGEVGYCSFGRAMIEEWTLYRGLTQSKLPEAVDVFIKHPAPAQTSSKQRDQSAELYCHEQGGIPSGLVGADKKELQSCDFADRSSIELMTLNEGPDTHRQLTDVLIARKR